MVSIITPVWNQSGLTHQFLFKNWQLYQHTPDVEFIIINNGSTDNTIRILDQWQGIMGDRLTVMNLPENIGFGPGNNRGAKEAKSVILIFISNDVLIRGDYVAPIRDVMQRNVLYGAQLLDYDTGWNKFGDLLIPYLAGHCLACSRKTWDKLGGFDEQFVPCDYEDIDLSYTACQKGIELKALSLPLEHMFGQSAIALEGGREKTTLRNQDLFKGKWGL